MAARQEQTPGAAGAPPDATRASHATSAGDDTPPPRTPQGRRAQQDEQDEQDERDEQNEREERGERDEQADRAAGRYELRVDATPANEAEWRRLRIALRLSRADLEWLKTRAPGVVRRGARSDLTPLLERLREKGFAASIQTRAVETDPS